MKKCAVILGSLSDRPIAEKAFDTLRALDIPFEARVLSAHRCPEELGAFVGDAENNGFGVIIACAGKAAHLAGAVAARTTLPVVGLPIAEPLLGGLDALLSTAQMPPGVPVAAVAIDGAENAALLAARILAIASEPLAGKLRAYKEKQRIAVLEKDAALARELRV
jgi:5-(carboxyamino)imidazole ribonucleotide mutase